MLLCLALSAVFLEPLVLLPFSSTALAAPRLASAPPTDEYLANAGVSLVRLLVTFNDTTGTVKTSFPCTGLGVLVSSWDSSEPTQLNASVLTDGALFNTKGPASGCIPALPPSRSIASVQIFFSDLYSHSAIRTPTLQPHSFSLTCSDTRDCGNGPALFSFHSALHLPFLALDLNSSLPGFKLALMNQQGAISPPNSPDPAIFSSQVSSFVTPKGVSSTDNSSFLPENGSPEVTTQGLILSLHLSNGQDSSASGLNTFLQSTKVLTHPETDLQKNWHQGLVDYYEAPVNHSAARQAFQLIAKENSQFQAPAVFLASLPTNNPNGTVGKTSGTTPASQFDPFQMFSKFSAWLVSNSQFGPLKIPNWTLIALVLILLLVLIAIFSLMITAYRRNREFNAAKRKAAIDAQHLSALEARQPSGPLPLPADWAQQPTLVTPAQQSPVLPPHPATLRTGTPPKPDLRCPRCLNPVPADANFCTHCSLLLSPTESGFHLRIKNNAPQPIVLPQPSSSSSVSSFSTPPSQSSQTTARPNPIVDYPTIEMSPAALNGSLNGSDQTAPLLQLQGHRLGLAVGTHSDPGIKRKLKPNEDSLFAAQGLRDSHSQQAEFGLFVVADGMGGHANGQDASRRAIQTIVDYMVPKLMHSGDASPDMLESLLQDGVQQANQAVHRNNVELHADMGTTITATLIVDTTAYVCNVGDSRTYLYRQGQGLRKVTNDHSVVASLVEAGIIKPDDIYTHPKRNQIYRSLGEKMNVEVDSFRVPLLAGDKLLLCSDGLWDMVRDPKIEDVIKNPLPDPNQTASDLIHAALEGGGEDNVSVIVVSMTESNYGLSTDFRLIAKPESVQIPPM